MDDIVRQSMAKWPNVPACFGWLGLDSRGDWWVRDAGVQAAGGFPSIYDKTSLLPKLKGSKLSHTKLISFIHRNYAADDRGRWYFQNGPQRVFVELEATPWIWRLQPDGTIRSHMDGPAHINECLCDEFGHLYLDTDLGFGLVHTQDTGLAALKIEAGDWMLQHINSCEISKRYGYVQHPQLENGCVPSLLHV